MNNREMIFKLRAFVEQLRALQDRARHIDDPDVRAWVLYKSKIRSNADLNY